MIVREKRKSVDMSPQKNPIRVSFDSIEQSSITPTWVSNVTDLWVLCHDHKPAFPFALSTKHHRGEHQNGRHPAAPSTAVRYTKSGATQQHPAPTAVGKTKTGVSRYAAAPSTADGNTKTRPSAPSTAPSTADGNTKHPLPNSVRTPTK